MDRSLPPEQDRQVLALLSMRSHVRRLVSLVRWSVPLILVVILGYRFTTIGWSEIWQSRPGSTAFYLVLALSFFVQPLADLLIYRNLWSVGRALRLSVLLRKRFLNSMMMDYSGEAYFFFWAQQSLNLSKSALLHAIKDSNILSAGAGLVTACILLVGLMLSGGVRLPDYISANLPASAILALVPLIMSLTLVFGGRRVTTLARSQIALTFAIHLTRSFIGLCLQFTLWWLSGALPSATMCLYFVGLRVLVSRLPLLPHKDLLFVGAALAASEMLELHVQAVVAVLVITAASDEILGFLFVIVPWLSSRLIESRNRSQSLFRGFAELGQRIMRRGDDRPAYLP